MLNHQPDATPTASSGPSGPSRVIAATARSSVSFAPSP
jgi:hypothetical protein